MPFTGDFAGLRRLERATGSLASGEENDRMLGDIQSAVKGLLRDQFARGVGPDGEPLEETVRGKAALVSRKLANVFQARIDRGSVRFVAKSARDMLRGHQFGVTFAARQVGEKSHFLTFDKNGRLIRNGRALNRKGEARRGVHQTYARAHQVGARVLPARPEAPDETLPARYETAIAGAVAKSLQRWGERAAR